MKILVMPYYLFENQEVTNLKGRWIKRIWTYIKPMRNTRNFPNLFE